MKNITVSVDEETHRMARIRAAELETSVSALVRGYLRRLVKGGPDIPGHNGVDMVPDVELRPRELDSDGAPDVLADFDARGIGLRMSENLSREELYDRGRARAEAEMGRGSSA